MKKYVTVKQMVIINLILASFFIPILTGGAFFTANFY